MAKVRYGSQEPTFQRVGSYTYTTGDDAIAMFNDYGVSFYPSQEYELRLFLAKDEEDHAAAKTVCISKPRQNGKSYATRFYAIWLAAVEGRNVLYTAHHGTTTREMFDQVCAFVANTPDFALSLEPNGIHRAQGSEGVYFRSGGYIKFGTRTNSAGRGGTFDVIVIDEAQELTDEQQEALNPTVVASASGDPQKIFLGTPPNAKCPGTVFRHMHDVAHDENSQSSAWWLEWAATEVGDPYDRERWYQCCPALGYRIREDVLADEAGNMPPDGFAREYLGWWSKRANGIDLAIEPQDWQACETDDPLQTGKLAYGVKFSPDGKHVALSAALVDDERSYVELLDLASTSRGTSNLAQWLFTRKDKPRVIVIDGKAGASALVQRLLDMGINKRKILECSTRTIQAASSMLLDEIKAKTVSHIASPELDASATTCQRRKIGHDGWGFGDSDVALSAPIESAALALFGARTVKGTVKKQKVGF